jgi:LacI family transcriptional regulator
LAIEYLIERGHRHIGIVGSQDKSPPSILERRAAYLETIAAQGLESYVENSDLLKATGYSGTKNLLQRSPNVTAIFACNDEVATGVIQALRELGKRIPEDVSVVGFDNVDYTADLYPPLTTIHVHKTWLGRLGVRMLVERTKNPNQPQITSSLATHLVERQSVAASPSSLFMFCSPPSRKTPKPSPMTSTFQNQGMVCLTSLMKLK